MATMAMAMTPSIASARSSLAEVRAPERRKRFQVERRQFLFSRSRLRSGSSSGIGSAQLRFRRRAAKILEDVSLCQDLVEKSSSSNGGGGVEEKGEGMWSRLRRAWKILFPPKHGDDAMSNARVAKLRLKMILIADRCSVNDEAKRKIVTNIVGALADFVEIESEDKVKLNVSSNPELGTLYYVTVPVRRVRPEYQDYSKEMESSWCLEASGSSD